MNVQDPLALRRAALMRQQRLIQEQLEQLEAVPALDEYPDGTVIKCRVSSGTELTYIFLKIVNPEGTSPRAQWYNTGYTVGHRHSDRSWRTTEELTKWLTEAGRVVLEWTLMLPAGTEPDTIIFETANDARMLPGSYVLKRAPERGDGRYVMG